MKGPPRVRFTKSPEPSLEVETFLSTWEHSSSQGWNMIMKVSTYREADNVVLDSHA
jgi:hypothetical protein